jgi:hypothetical protein
MSMFRIIGIDHDDADTWSIVIEARNPRDAIALVPAMTQGIHNREDVRYVIRRDGRAWGLVGARLVERKWKAGGR